MYSQTLMAQTCPDSRCEFDPLMGLRDTRTEIFHGSSCVLYVYHRHHGFIIQSC